MKYLNIDGHHFYNMVVNASNRLEEQKDFINSLNVFPVPDGDTGTNMSMTLRNAVLDIDKSKDSSIGSISTQLAIGALIGARGNSGLTLSQIFRGISNELQGKKQVNSVEFAKSLQEGAKSAYKAVMRPIEGTILTVIRGAGESAVKSNKIDITELLQDVCNYSRTILNKTSNMLSALKKAKVVDAGGMGFLIMMQGMQEALKEGKENIAIKEVHDGEIKSVTKDLGRQDIVYIYCIKFFIHCKGIDVNKLKEKLSIMGDPIVVADNQDIVKVHIHTNNPGWILSEAIKLGELSKIKVENMREQLNIEDL